MKDAKKDKKHDDPKHPDKPKKPDTGSPSPLDEEPPPTNPGEVPTPGKGP